MSTALDAVRLPDLSSTVVLLDIDGTLAPIVDDPSAAEVPPHTVSLVEQLARRAVLVGAITGRGIAEARRMLPVEGIWFAASHGMHLVEPDGTEHVDEAALRARPQLDLAATMAHTVGWRFEDKVHSLTVHFRHTSNPQATAAQMRAQMSTVLDPSLVTVEDARMALEIRPVGALRKGDAARRLCAEAADRAASVVFLGDDLTDLDAVRALGDTGLQTLSIAVSSEEMPPQMREECDAVLEDQRDVAQLLARWLSPPGGPDQH